VILPMPKQQPILIDHLIYINGSNLKEMQPVDEGRINTLLWKCISCIKDELIPYDGNIFHV